MPFLGSVEGVLGYGRGAVLGGVDPGVFNQLDLAAFSNWHMSNASNIANTNITNFYAYLFDGTANSISDGGFDMWDSGNFISLTGFQTASNINYGTLSNTPASGYGFFVSQASRWPQVALAWVKNGTIQWHNAGDVGTDGGGANSNFAGTYTTPSGRYGSYWVNQNYGTPDPTICYLYFTVQNTYGGGITSSNDLRKTANPPANTYTQSFSVTGSNLIFGQMLLSVRNATPIGFLIPQATVAAFLSNYVQAATLNTA